MNRPNPYYKVVKEILDRRIVDEKHVRQILQIREELPDREPEKPAENVELNKWKETFPISEHPNGADDVKSFIEGLERFAKDLVDLLRKYDKNPELLELPPTPPNTPETMKPVGSDDTDIPPIINHVKR